MSRETLANTLPISAGAAGGVLQILVENQGRINFEIANDFKGIIDGVSLNNFDRLENWNITGFPFENESKLNELLSMTEQDSDVLTVIENRTTEFLQNGPMILQTTFDVKQDEILDTYINPVGWGKVMNIFTESQKEPTIKSLFFRSQLHFNTGFHCTEWFQFGTILATCWSTNHIVCAERDSTQTGQHNCDC